MSQITVGSIQNLAGDGAASLYEGVAKAWASIDGGTTPAIEESLNVGSITDTGVGARTPNLSSSMSAATYGVVAAPTANDNNAYYGSRAVGSVLLTNYDIGAAGAADAGMTFSIAGDLA